MSVKRYNRCPSLHLFRKSFDPLSCYTRNSFIPSSFIGSRISVHIGNQFKSILIKPLIINYRLGDFAFTKFRGFDIHKRKRKKK
jgi:ribosomal protein S19